MGERIRRFQSPRSPPERPVDVSHAGRVHRLLRHLRHERVKLPLIGQGGRRRPGHAQLFGGANRLFFALSHDSNETPVADDRHEPRHPAHRAIVNVQHGCPADAVHGPHKWSEHAAVQHPVEPEIVDEASPPVSLAGRSVRGMDLPTAVD